MKDELINKFKSNNLWIHITKNDLNLLEDLIECLSDCKFINNVPLNAELLEDIITRYGEIWLRYQESINYSITHPRISPIKFISPEVYNYSEIIDTKEFLEYNLVVISEEELNILFA